MIMIKIPSDKKPFNQYLSDIPHAAVLLDQKGDILYANEILLEVSQKPLDFFQGKPYHCVVGEEKTFDRFIQTLIQEPFKKYPFHLLAVNTSQNSNGLKVARMPQISGSLQNSEHILSESLQSSDNLQVSNAVQVSDTLDVFNVPQVPMTQVLLFTVEEPISEEPVLRGGSTPKNEAKGTKEQEKAHGLMSKAPEGKVYGLILLDINRTLNLSLSQRLLENIMSHVNTGVLAIDAEERIVAISDKACFFLDVQKERVLHQKIGDLFPNLPEEYRIVERTLHDGLLFHDHAISWMSHGKRYDLLVDSYLLKNESSAIEGAYATFKDVTSLRSLDNQIQRNERLAMIGQIAAGTAHEIRNPLTSIQGFLQMLYHSLSEKELHKEQEYIRFIMTELDRINHLISEFLMLSKPKDVSYTPLHVHDALLEILPFIETEAKMKGIQVVTRLKGEMPQVLSNKELLKQVFMNIAKNGIDAMEQGGTLTLSEHLDEAEGMLVFDIHDTGPGIPSYVVDRIFDPFFTTKENGTGLGLSICQRILHDMGGSLKVSTKGYGTTFHIHLPIK